MIIDMHAHVVPEHFPPAAARASAARWPLLDHFEPGRANLMIAGANFRTIHSGNWDHHSNIKNHGKLGNEIDRPIAGLIRDLRLRGMLDETLIVFATEFGRTPFEDSNPTGRGHHRHAFTCWLGGGGVKGGTTYGASDEIGNLVAGKAVTIHDFHATILHLLGIDHEQLTYRHTGRDFRLTDVHRRVIRGIIGLSEPL